MFRKDLSRILSGFSKTVSDLEAFEAQCAEDISVRDEKISTLQGERALIAGDRQRATRIADNLRRILEQ